MIDYSQLEKAIGYNFKDKKLLMTALTHSSYANEHNTTGYEKLEFLGDSVLNFLVTEYLIGQDFRDEGAMSVVRSNIVSRKPLCAAAISLKLDKYLLLGEGAKNDIMSVKFKSNLFESVLGAMYLDCRNFDICRKFVFANLSIAIKEAVKTVDFKSKLQEYVQSKGGKIEYVTEQIAINPPWFIAYVMFESASIGEGEGGNKKSAQVAAAKEACKFFKLKV